MTNTVNRMKLALVLALVAGLLAATIGLFGSGWPPSVSAQTDTTAPTVSSVAITSDAGNGVYGIGDDIEATVTFSEDVTVTDTPRLGLDIGGTSKTASYESTSGSTVVFSYTVAEGDSDHDGIAIRANRLILSGGTIRDAADNDADLSHDALSAQEDHEVDGIRPSVSRIYIPASTHTTDRAFTIGDPIWIYTDWSERLYVTGNPQLTLDFDGTSKTSTYTDGWLGHFSEYTVVEGDSAPDGVAIPANAISLNGGSIRDRAGNDAVLTHSAVSADSLSWTFIPVDGIRPTITSIEIISDPGDDDTYTAGDEIRILVTFSENIQPVDRSGEGRIFQTTIELNIGGKARTAEHFGHLDAVIALTYTVQAGDTDANGISIDANKMWNGPVLHPDGYTLLDRPSASNWAAGNPADVSHDAVADDSGHKVAAAPQPNNPATGAPTISGTVQVGETLWTNTAGIADNDGLDNADFAYQWITNDGTIDTDIAGATGATYTLVSEDAGKTIRVQVSFTDDTGNKERLTSTPTAAVSAAPPPPPDNVRAVTQKSGAVELTWEAPDGATVAGYRIERRRADEDRRDNHTLVEDTGSSETGYTDESAEKGVEYEYRVSARNEDGAGEASGWVSAATVPTISSVAITSDPDDDDLSEYYDDSVYAIGDSIKVTATFSENVTVTGAPKLEVNIGGKAKTATYDSSKDNEVVFSYTVAEGDSDTDGIAVGANKLSLNAGTIKDGADNSAVLTHSALSVQSGHKVDGIRPTVTSVYFVPTSFGNDGIHTIGERLWVQVVLSEDSRVYIGPRIILNLEGTSTSVGFSPLSRGSNLVFFYIVKKGDLDLDGVSVSANSLTARGLTDAAGNDAVLTHTGVSEDPDYIVDGVPPTVSSIAITSDPGDDDTYSIGNKIEITVTLSEDVGVFFGPWGGPWDGPQVALNIGGSPKSASFVSENAGVMLFSYTVKYGDNDADGVSIDANSLSGGIVRDTNGDSFSSGNDADLRHTSVDDDADHKVTTTTPAKSADATLSGLTLTDVNFGTFASGTTSYSADVANSVTQTTVTPTVNHSDASYIIKLGGVTDADETVALAVGSNVITVEVTAEDGNTTRTYTVTVTRAATSISAPDLTVPSVITSSSPFGYNPSFNLGVNVTNRGSGSSGLTTLHYYRSTDSTITSGDAEVGTDSVDALAASGISNEDIDLTAPDTPGTYYYGACVDAVADESDTTNNCSPGIAWVVPAAPSSTDATGAPAISGTVQVGETLTADTSGIADDDGLENVSFSYQWLTDDTAIQGATNSTYTLIEADEGKTVKVRVSFTDDAGNDESLTSAATDAVAATPNSPATGAPTISGTAQVGETLTADTSGIADADGLENVTHSYQWLAGDSDISGATGSAYTLADADEGNTVKVRVSFTDDGGNDETLTSAATEAVAGNKEPVAREDVVAWSAIMTVEWVYQGYGYYSTHAKKAGSLSPASFEVDGTTYTVKMVETQGWWMYIGVDRELPFDFVLELNGTRFASNDASFNSYNYGNIYRWEGTGLSLRDGDTVEVRLLRAFEDETAVNSAATGAPVISGTVQVGETLTADTSGVEDADGLDNAVFGYQWLAGDTEIQGATNADYTLADADEGKAIKVQVSFTDDAGNDETLTSAATDAVTAAPTPNSPATGQPTVSGTAQVGETLTADTSGIADEDGLDNAAFTYQWLSDTAEIAGATGSTHTLADADEGKAIKVQVTFTDDAGNDETLTSAATDAVTAAPPENNEATGAPSISGTAQVGETLTVDTSGIADTDGLENSSFTYQWLADDTAIQGAMGSSYTLADTDEGKAIKVQVSFTDDAGNDETLTSAATDPVSAAPTPNNPATGAPAINGTAQVGETLMANTSGIADENGLENVTFSYQWLADDDAIAVATGSTHTLADADEGKAIKVQVSFTDDAGNDETLTSAATDAVAATPNSPATGAPTIGGTIQVGETLTADTSGIADADGLDNAAFTYQWLAGDSDISSATGSTYALADADEGKAIKVKVSFTDDGGNDETLTSAATEAVAGNKEPVAREDVVAWSAIMTVEWVYQGYGYYSTHAKKAGSLSPASFEVDGTTYTVKMVETQGWWMYIGVDRELPFDFVLELNGTRFASNDASFNSYNYGNIYRWEGTGLSLRDGDAVEVRLLRAFEDETAVNSAATGAPTISGTAQVGETLTADTSGISDADGLTSVSFSYQWLAGDSDISGATGSTYTLPDADEGKAITVQVSFTDDAGNDETLTSAATDAVATATQPNNPATGAPTISGTVQVGETLTVDTTGISDADGLTNATLSYQWLADDADISGATGSTYTLTDSDEGKAIKVQVSFTDDAGNDETLTSAATDPVDAALAANSPATGAPTISGTAQVGETLTVDTSDIADMDGLTNADFSYQWQADDTAIQGAMGSSYTLADTDEGKPIKVRVSFTDDGGNDETLTSAATDAVAALEPPARPTGLTAEVSHDSVTLTWDGPNDDSITGYVILRRDKDIHEEGTFETVESDTGSAGTTYTDDTVEPEKQYVYRIKAINADGLSEISSWVRADTPAAPTPEPPAAPSGLTAEVSNNTVTLIWDDPNDDTITGYVILRRNRDTDAEGQFTELVADTGSAATGYTDDTVAAETPYTYRIKAINEHGTSERSRWFHIDTPAAPAPEPTQEPTPEPESVSEGDTDLPNDNSTPGRVAVGGSATGAIGTAGDQDRFAVELVAGRTYQFDLTGSPGGGGTLPDTFFRAIYNSEGQYQADSYNDDFDGGRDSRVTFTATESGTYYARVSGDRDEVGSYTLSVTDVTPQ